MIPALGTGAGSVDAPSGGAAVTTGAGAEAASGSRSTASAAVSRGTAPSALPAAGDIYGISAPFNTWDILFGTMEFLLLILLLPGIISFQKRILWNKKQTDEYRRHHIKWKEPT